MIWTLSALAATLHVPADHPTLTDAVLAAVDGDTIMLGHGTFEGANFEVGSASAFIVRGQGATTIVTDSSPNVLYAYAGASLELHDLVVDGGSTSRGLFVQSGAGPIVLDDVLFRNGLNTEGAAGGCVYNEGAGLTVVNSTLRNCSSSLGGGGIYAKQAATVVIRDTRFEANQSTVGGAVKAVQDSTLEVVGATFDANIASEYGGAIALESGAGLTATGTTFLRNTATGHSGAIHGDGSVAVDGCTFSDNHAGDQGGAIRATEVAVIQRTDFLNNSALTGGGLYVSDNLELRNTMFCGNAADSGSAVEQSTTSFATVDNSLFLRNGNGLGYDVYLEGTSEVRHSTFIDNLGNRAFHAHNLVEASIFQDATIDAADGILHDNLFWPVQRAGQFHVDPELQDYGAGCVRPYPTAGVFDRILGTSDPNGTPSDLGHLGGPGVDFAYWGADLDNDLYAITEDCDDTNDAVHPGGTEVCNGLDDDCDGEFDEGVTIDVYDDLDGDGLGAGSLHPGCLDDGQVAIAGDCDDTDPAIGGPFPSYIDDDYDGYGDLELLPSCTLAVNAVLIDGDCDDTDLAIHPGAPEVCDAVDNNCDGSIDEGLTLPLWWVDSDGDEYGAGPSIARCEGLPGEVDNGDDCDDTDPTIHPGADDPPGDGIDSDCSGVTDQDDDGVPDLEELDGDYDGDGLDDLVDPDSDNDGVLDGAETDREARHDAGTVDQPLAPAPAYCSSTSPSGLYLGGLVLLAMVPRRKAPRSV